MMPLRLVQVSRGAGSNDVWKVFRRLILHCSEMLFQNKRSYAYIGCFGRQDYGSGGRFASYACFFGCRVVDGALPLLATFDGVQRSLPSKAVMDSVDF